MCGGYLHDFGILSLSLIAGKRIDNLFDYYRNSVAQLSFGRLRHRVLQEKPSTFLFNFVLMLDQEVLQHAVF
jgi:hypothetical protein